MNIITVVVTSTGNSKQEEEVRSGICWLYKSKSHTVDLLNEHRAIANCRLQLTCLALYCHTHSSCTCDRHDLKQNWKLRKLVLLGSSILLLYLCMQWQLLLVSLSLVSRLSPRPNSPVNRETPETLAQLKQQRWWKSTQYVGKTLPIYYYHLPLWKNLLQGYEERL